MKNSTPMMPEINSAFGHQIQTKRYGVETMTQY
jgi:hypothetical protein